VTNRRLGLRSLAAASQVNDGSLIVKVGAITCVGCPPASKRCAQGFVAFDDFIEALFQRAKLSGP